MNQRNSAASQNSDHASERSPDSVRHHGELPAEYQYDEILNQTVDPRDLVSKGQPGNVREIIENPAVTPEMLDEPIGSRGHFRDDQTPGKT